MGGTEQPCSTFYGAGNLGKISSTSGQNEIQFTEGRKHNHIYNYMYTYVFVYTPCDIKLY